MKIGFIGLGNVGGKLAESLLRNKFDLTVRDLDNSLTNEFKAKGVKVANSPKELAQEVDLIINTPLGKQSRFDEYEIGKAAIRYNVLVLTTISGAQAIVRAIRTVQQKKLNYYSLQEIFR